jgi:hypothetical protein
VATLTFNTLDATKKLREAGFNEKQAETVIRVLHEAQTNLVTREYLDTKLETLELRLVTKLETLELRLTVKLGGLITILAAIMVAILRLPSHG